jgi:hypothetical protein
VKQRVRIRRVKENTYKYYIYMWALKRKWKSILAEMRKLSDAVREAYEKERREREMSQVPEGRQEPSVGEPTR